MLSSLKQLPLQQQAEGGTQAKSPGGWQARKGQQATQVKQSERGAEPLAPERRPEGRTSTPQLGDSVAHADKEREDAHDRKIRKAKGMQNAMAKATKVSL